jgi:hypothetical protein
LLSYCVAESPALCQPSSGQYSRMGFVTSNLRCRSGVTAMCGMKSTSRPSLLAVTYSAAFTCTGTDFVPVEGKEAVISIGEDTPLDFVAADAPAP